jgi:hypothetical protein
MPKTLIDYSNTIIYKITCKDPAVTDVYVGHTTNFVQRKHAHKQSCISAKSANHKCKLYEVMRNNGGWDNWQMEIINFFKCHDHYEARQKEQEYFISLHATLNSIEPMPKPKSKEIIIKKNVIKQTYYCDVCKTHCDSIASYEKHNETNKHKKKIKNESDGITLPKVSDTFICEHCHFKCYKQSNYTQHMLTDKHKRVINDNKMITENAVCFQCDTCNTSYKHKSGLCRHKKICKTGENLTKHDNFSENIIIDTNTNNDIQQLTSLVIEVVKNNNEFQNKILDLCKNIQSVLDTINNSL